MRIRQKYTITLLITAIAPLLLAMVFVHWQSKEQTTQLSLNNAQNQLESAAQSLGGFFNSRISEISAYTESPLLKSMEFSKIRPFIISELNRHDGVYEKFILGTPESYFYNTSGGNPGKKMLRTFNDKDPQAKPKSIAKRDYWKATVGNNKLAKNITMVSNPMISYTTGAKQIVVASTIRVENKVVGMLGGALPWHDMEKQLNKLFSEIFFKNSLNKNVFLVSNSGIYWYHWDKEKIVHLKTDELGKPLLNDMGQKISVSTNIKDDENKQFSAIGENIILGKKGYEKFTDKNTGKVNYAVYTNVPATPYSIALVIPESVILAPVYSLEKLFVFTLIGVILLAFFVALINSRQISSPILKLNRAAKNVNFSNLHELNIVTNDDEIGELTKSFNHMIVDLRNEHDYVLKREKEITDLNHSLEQRIQERTITLEATNKILAQKIEEDLETKNLLIQHKDLLQNTGQLAKVGGWQTNEGNNELYTTSEIYDLLNLPTNKALTMEDLINCFPAKERDLFAEEFENARKNGKSFEIDLKTTKLNNRDTWCRIIGAAKTDNGKITCINGAIQDITQLKKVDKLKNEFVSTVSHEIRTPLTSITGSIGLIKNGVVGEISVEAKKLVDLIDKNATRLLFLINDILDIEKIESGKMEYNISKVDLKNLLEQAIEGNQSYAEKFDCFFVISEFIENIIVQADAQRLLQVMANLLSNAAKFSTRNTEIKIGMSLLADSKIRVYFKDTGPGISEEFRGKIFEKFTQEDGSTERKYAGTGLGLNISKAIIEHHNGTIDFESSPNGSIFYFDLPISNADNEQIEASSK